VATIHTRDFRETDALHTFDVPYKVLIHMLAAMGCNWCAVPTMWDEPVQRKLGKESNAYAFRKFGSSGSGRGISIHECTIMLGELRKFMEICIFMGIRRQPSMKGFWSVGRTRLHCQEVAVTILRNRFLNILKCLHIAPKSTITYDWTEAGYDRVVQVRWLVEQLVGNFQSAWKASPYLCVDECMVAYNGKFYSFKQYLPLKLVSHGIKLWCLACSITKYVWILKSMLAQATRHFRNFHNMSGGCDTVDIGMEALMVHCDHG
jgi:hypothetical protein